MRKQLLVALLVAAPLGVATAGNPDAGCGLGTTLWEGNLNAWWSKSLAVTTNGTSGNNTFGITSGTLGCSTEGSLLGNAQLTEFASANMDSLAADMARGTGESLDVLAALYGVSAADQSAFKQVLQESYENIYTSMNVTTEEMLVNVNAAISSSESLSRYALSS